MWGWAQAKPNTDGMGGGRLCAGGAGVGREGVRVHRAETCQEHGAECSVLSLPDASVCALQASITVSSLMAT